MGWGAYLIFVIFFTRAKFLENKIYTEKTRKLRQNTQKIANILRYYGKIHSKLAIFHVKSVKIYTGQKKFTRIHPWDPWQISGMLPGGLVNREIIFFLSILYIFWNIWISLPAARKACQPCKYYIRCRSETITRNSSIEKYWKVL